MLLKMLIQAYPIMADEKPIPEPFAVFTLHHQVYGFMMKGYYVAVCGLNAFIDIDDVARVGVEWQVVIFKNFHVT